MIGLQVSVQELHEAASVRGLDATVRTYSDTCRVQTVSCIEQHVTDRT